MSKLNRSQFSLLGTMLVLLLAPASYAQSSLEFFTEGFPAPPNGPTTGAQSSRFILNTDNPTGNTRVTPTTNVQVTASLSNQQHTGVSTGTGNPVVMFGATNGGGPGPVVQATYRPMNVIGSPVNTNFSNTVGGTNQGMDVAVNHSFNMYTSVQQWTAGVIGGDPASNSRVYMADLTITFSSPVTNPLLQFTGMGGTTGSLGLSTELNLTSAGQTLTKVQGNAALVVAPTQITNGSGTIAASCASTAACGSVRVNGSNITFQVFVRGDTALTTWSTGGQHAGDQWMLGVSLPEAYTISGNVFNDANGLTDSTVNGAALSQPSGVQLYANLVDPTDNSVIASVAIASDGTYSFTGAPGGGVNYRIDVSTNQGTALSPAPARQVPAGWVNTGENLGGAAGNDGTVDGALSVTVGTAAVTSANFGIEQRPVANNNTAPSQVNPGSNLNLTVPPATFTATDGAPGTITSIRITAFPSNVTSITINGITYTSGTFPVGGVTVPANAAGNPTQPILVNPFDGPRTINIPYVAIDNAGIESSAPGIATLPVTAGTTAGEVMISGRVLDDQGRGAPRARITVVGQDGVVYTALSNPFGYFQVQGLDVNELYIVRVGHKRFNYEPRTINLADDFTGMDFVPQP